MKTIGIVAEYNPFHLGHQWQIVQSRVQMVEPCGVVAVMSGHWTQGAYSAVTDKWTRAHMALLGGVDLVLELPLPYAMSSAECFARGAIGTLAATGLDMTLSFGSELGELAPLQRIATALDSPQYPPLLQGFLSQGMSFPTAREGAVAQLLGDLSTPLATANNNLGVEYLRAINTIAPHMSAMTVKRRGAGHESYGVVDGFASATQIRQLLADGRLEESCELMPSGVGALLEGKPLSHMKWGEMAILYVLRTMSVEGWSALPDSGVKEGLPHRLYRCGQQATSVEEFLTLAKTKRYTHARIRRLIGAAFLGLDASCGKNPLPYIRVLGSNGVGRTLLKEMKGLATVPIVTNPKEVRTLGEDAQTLFHLESHGTDCYGLTFSTPWPCGVEWTKPPVVL